MTTQNNAQTNDALPPVWKKSAFFRKFEAVVSLIEDWLNLGSVYIIMFLMFFATAEIVGRYFFNNPIPGHVELVELIMAGIVFLGIAYTERVNGHIRMELFVTHVLKGRAYHLAEVITSALSLMVYFFIMVYSFKSTMFAIEVGDTTAYLYWPTWPSKLVIPIGSFFLCLRFTIEIIQHFCQFVVGVEKRDLS